jgi:prevent-host-death family protein
LDKQELTMADTVSLDDATTDLSQLVERAASGEEIVISKNGIPATLTPAGAVPPLRPSV